MDDKPQAWNFDAGTIPDPTQQRAMSASYNSVASSMAQDTKGHIMSRSALKGGFFSILIITFLLSFFMSGIAGTVMGIMLLVHILLAIFTHQRKMHAFYILGYILIFGYWILFTIA